MKAGEYRGLSLDFSFEYEFVEYEIEIPEIVEGDTEEEEDTNTDSLHDSTKTGVMLVAGLILRTGTAIL
ncbi:hypothetical protein [Vibrio phage J14]|nr:hypothetical protein [Vibrio phage J14]